MPVEVLRIENFKSIKNLKLDCRKVNLFIGEPNAGKSNVLEAIGLLSHVGYGDIKGCVRFESMPDLFYDRVLDNQIVIGFDEKRLEVSFSDGMFLGEYEYPHGDVVSRNRVFNYGYSGSGSWSPHDAFRIFKFYRFHALSEFRSQKSDFLHPPFGDNFMAILMSRKRLRTIGRELFEKFGYRIVFRLQEGRIEIQKELEDIVFAFPYSLTSETLQRLLFYLAAIYSNEKSTLAFEEPEAHAFPYYTKYLAERIAVDENDNQYFITTHNPYFLTSILEKTPKSEVAIFATRLESYQTKVKSLTEKQKEKILVDMGYDFFFTIDEFFS